MFLTMDNTEIITEQEFFKDLATDTKESEAPKVDFFEQTEKSPEISETAKKAKKETAKFIIKRVDDAISLISSMISDESPDKYRADKEDLKELIKLLETMLPDASGVIPPGIMLLITFIFAYTPVLKKSFKDRKKNKQKEVEGKKEKPNKLFKQVLDLQKTNDFSDKKEVNEPIEKNENE